MAETREESEVITDLGRTDRGPTRTSSEFHFFELPVELQDQILRFAMWPRDVHPPSLYFERPFHSPAPPLNTKVAKCRELVRALCPRKLVMPTLDRCKGAGHQKLAVQLLATSKEMYQRCHFLFYVNNVFHLPPGPVVVLEQYFNRILRPESKSLIRFVHFEFSFNDLTLHDFLDTESYLNLHSALLLRGDRNRQISVWIQHIMMMLHVRWYERLQWLEKWHGLTIVAYSIHGKEHVLPPGLTGIYLLDWMRWARMVGWTNTAESMNHPGTRKFTVMYCLLMQEIVWDLRQQFDECGLDHIRVIYRWKTPFRSLKLRLLDVQSVRNWLFKRSPLDSTNELRLQQAENALRNSNAGLAGWQTFKELRVGANLKSVLRRVLTEIFRQGV